MVLRVVVLLFSVTVLLTACAPSRTPAAVSRRVVAPAPPSPALPSPAPLPAITPSPAPAGWTADPEPARGFDLSYPPGWAPKAAATAGPDHVYYATADAPAPLEMGPDDVWLTVQTEAPDADGACPVSLPGEDGGRLAVRVGGKAVALQLRDPRPGSVEPTWKAYAVTGDGRRCFVIWFVTLNEATRTRDLPTMRQILAEFMPTAAANPSPSPWATAPSPSPSPVP